MLDRVLALLTRREKQEIESGPYRDLSKVQLEELRRENAINAARGIGNFVYKNDPPVWISPHIDSEHIAEFRRRGIEYSGHPLAGLTEEEIKAYQAQTMAILREEEDRYVVIDACRPEVLKDTLDRLTREGQIVFWTPYNHTLPVTIYGPVTYRETVTV